MNLVIVESPTKAKTIGKILGDEFLVKSSVGHVRDLPKHSLGVDVKHNFEPSYEIVDSHERVIKELVSAAKDCGDIYLAPDPDREGEAIAWHLREVLDTKLGKKKKRNYLRVSYNEITADAVRSAISNPREIDMARVNEQQARRILDRLVGYKVSPVLWGKLSRGLSAGRVQSVALRLVCEREEQIRGFKPEAYWIFTSEFSKLSGNPETFTARLAQINGEKADIKSEDAQAKVLEDLSAASFHVSSVVKREIKKRPPPPFITSTLQQAASTACGFSPSQTMLLAQRLFEGIDIGGGDPVGLITYMRTDSVSVSAEACAAAADFIEKRLGKEFLPANARLHKNKEGAQGAHEAVRPTDPSRTPESLKGRIPPREHKLYDLIWRRFIASRMKDAVIGQTTVKITSDPVPGKPEYTFSATASEEIFAGFLKVYDFRRYDAADSDADAESDSVQTLPALTEGEPLKAGNTAGERKETKPPARYSEASLVRALDANGIGRPSTYASILSTLTDRKYVVRKGKSLEPTELGSNVNEILVKSFPQLFNVKFTSQMEKELDEVGEEKMEWHQMVSDLYDKLQVWLKEARGPGADLNRVKPLLDAFEHVREWAPPTTSGRRKYDDRKFVEDMRRTISSESAAGSTVSERQLDYLARIACRYSSSVPELAEAVKAAGFGSLLEKNDAPGTDAETMKKFELIEKAGVPEKSAAFFNSLRSQALSGRKLSEKQVKCLNRLLLEVKDSIDGFSDELCAELGIETAASKPAEAGARKAGSMIDALGTVTAWDEPVKRGARTYDDKAFFQSLSDQFHARGSLSNAQIAALERLVVKYKSQLRDFAALAKENGINPELALGRTGRAGSRAGKASSEVSVSPPGE